MSTSEAISFSMVLSSSSREMSLSIESLFAQSPTLSCSFWKPNTAATMTRKTEISKEYSIRLVRDIVSRCMSSQCLSAGRSICTSRGTIISNRMNEAYTRRVYQLRMSSL